MQLYHMSIIIILLFSLFDSFYFFNTVHLNPWDPVNITNLKENDKYVFNFDTYYPQKLRIQIITPESFKNNFENANKYEYIKIKEYTLYQDYFMEEPLITHYNPEFRNLDDKMIIDFFIDIEDKRTTICVFDIQPKFNLSFFYVDFELGKDWDLSLSKTYNFSNLKCHLNYRFFIDNIKRFQRLNVRTSIVSFESLHNLYIEYNNTIDNNIYSKKKIIYDYKYLLQVDDYNNFNFKYDIKNNTKIAFIYYFIFFDVDNFTISVTADGGDYEFENNITKKISNLKYNYPYYFFTKATQYQISKITITNDCYGDYPFDVVDIYEYNNKSYPEKQIIEKQFLTNKKINNEKCIISFTYNTKEKDITDIAFRFIPKYYLDFIMVKIENMGGSFILNNNETKLFNKVIPGYELFFWIKGTIFQKMTLNIKLNNTERIPFSYISLYEYDYQYYIDPFLKYLKYINQPITPEIINNKELFYYSSYIIEYPDTKYILLKLNPAQYIENLEINVNVKGNTYDLENNVSLSLDKIEPDLPYYFFIEAITYNQLLIQLSFNDLNIDKNEIKYININDYESKNNITYIRSIEQSFEIKRTVRDSKINIKYTPSKLTKYISLIIETKNYLNYSLETKIEVTGGIFDFVHNKNISNIKAGSIYYFPFKITLFKKINIDITMNNNINNKAFINANIYEKQNKNDDIYIKYYNQTLLHEKNNRYVIESFTYSIDNFKTNYILIELIPNINLDYIFIKYDISKSYNELDSGELMNISNTIANYPYFYSIKSNQYQQVNINLSTKYILGNNPFVYIEIYELGDLGYINSYNKYVNKSIQFIKENNDNIVSASLSYTIDSIYTSYITIKIVTKDNFNYLCTKMDVGGGYYEIEKGVIKNISNLFIGFSYYVFVISSIREKLNIKLTMNTNSTKTPFNSLNIYEYSNKNSRLIYLKNTQDKFNTEIKNNSHISLLSYEIKDNNTNFIALKLVPNYNISSIECFVELVEEKKSSSSLIKILVIILVLVISITAILFIIYIKKSCSKDSYIIENIDTKNNNHKEKKFELSLLNIEPIASIN